MNVQVVESSRSRQLTTCNMEGYFFATSDRAGIYVTSRVVLGTPARRTTAQNPHHNVCQHIGWS